MKNLLVLLVFLTFSSFDAVVAQSNKTEEIDTLTQENVVYRDFTVTDTNFIAVNKNEFEQTIKNQNMIIDFIKWTMIISFSIMGLILTLSGLAFAIIKYRDDKRQVELITSLKEEYSKYQVILENAKQNMDTAQKEMYEKTSKINELKDDMTKLGERMKQLKSDTKQFEEKMEDKTDKIAEASRYLNMAFEASKKENYSEAVKLYTKVINTTPDEMTKVIAHNNRANCYISLKDYDGAINDCNIGLDLKKDYLLYFNRGDAFAGKKFFDLAIKDFNQAEVLRNDWFPIFSHRGHAYYLNRDFENAIKDFKQAIQLNANDFTSSLNLAELYIITEDFDRAKEFIEISKQVSTDGEPKLIAYLFDIVYKIINNIEFKNEKSSFELMTQNTAVKDWSMDFISDYVEKSDLTEAKKTDIKFYLSLLS